MISKKDILTGLGILLLILIAAFFNGPRVEIDTAIQPVNLPTDLAGYLQDSEAAFDDIVPGTEKTIIWAGEAGIQTPLSVIYLHGFSASRQETAPLSEMVAAMLEANLFCTRFTGHGRGSDAMLDGSVNAWLNDTQEAIEIGRRLGRIVLVIGVSTGGTAATWLATQSFTKHVAAFVLISPNYAPADSMSRILLWPWGSNIAEWIVGKEYSWEPHNEEHGRYWTHRFPTRALLPMMCLVNMVNSLDLSAIETPVLVIYSPDDQVVNTASIKAAFSRMGSSQKMLVPYTQAQDPSRHVLAGDILSPESTAPLAEMIVNFVRKI